MRLSTLALVPLFALPLAAFALDYTDQSKMYTDAPFVKPEAVAISVLTNLKAIKGNDDGSFAASRTLNRAEFLKIAFLSTKNLPMPTQASSCFPDVKSDHWFAVYVCFAKNKGVVKGYPDGLFHPEKEVNYAEALKMLGELNSVMGEEDSTEPWYGRYVRAAQERGLLLPMTLPYDRFLTRGQMARLAASYRAESEGELAQYRAAEQGKKMSSASSAMQCTATCPDGYEYATCAADGSPINYFADPCLTHQLSSSSKSSMMSSSARSSSATSVAAPGIFPAMNHFILAAATSPVLLDGTFLATEEEGEIRFVTLRLRQEVRSLSGFVLVDSTGFEIGKLKLATDDTTNTIWKGDFPSGGYRLKKGVPVQLGVKAQTKLIGSVSSELFDTAEFYIQVQGVQTGASKQILPTNTHYPYHQTALARIVRVGNELPDTGSVQQGLRRQIASFTFSGAIANGGALRLTELDFHIESSGVQLSNFKVGGSAEIQQADCSTDPANTKALSCSTIPDAVSTITGNRVISLYASVTVADGAVAPWLQVSLESPGSVGVNGSVHWTDGSGNFNWIEGASPVAKSARLDVSK